MEAASRKEILKPVKRVVVKVGSGVLTTAKGLNFKVMKDLSKDISSLRENGVEFILVSSGAIAAGLKKMGLKKRPHAISSQQAIAAMGQSSLMMAYEKAFISHGVKVAQILTTRDDLTHRRRYLNARNTLLTLLSWKIVPIINENDTVVVDEIKYGDNDNLSAMVVNLSDSQLLINLTDIEGLFDKNPRTYKDARLIKMVKRVDQKVSRYADAIPGFLGTGGMASKVGAAKKVALAGVPTIIANGLKPHIIKRIFAGHDEGTLFLPRKIRLSSRKHWIAFTKSPKGKIIIDSGAQRAILENGKSLLPSGIMAVKGKFSVGNTVLLVSHSGKQVAVGMVNYDSVDIEKIMGVNTNEIESRLGFKHDDEIIHRDNLVLSDQMEEGDK